MNAGILQQEGRLGVLAPGAHADVIAVSGNPLADITTLAQPAALDLIVKAGATHKNNFSK